MFNLHLWGANILILMKERRELPGSRWVNVEQLERVRVGAVDDADRWCAVVDAQVARHWGRLLRRLLPEGTSVVVWAGGERRKRWRSIERLFAAWMTAGLTRRSVVVGIGGGALLDAVGLAASVYKRGVRTIWLPTTLLAMVDAAIGGKTAVNFRGVKNLLGTFHRPERVVQCPDFLRTLPRSERLSGMGEVVKHALIEGGVLWRAVRRIPAEELPDLERIRPLIEPAARLKAEVVEADPYEGGLRRVLNVGHTVGHALEAYWAASRRRMPHGLAVVVGMAWETAAAYAAGWTDAATLDAVLDMAARFPLRQWAAERRRWWPFLLHDKKNQSRSLGLALIRRPGDVQWNVQWPWEAAHRYFAAAEELMGERGGKVFPIR